MVVELKATSKLTAADSAQVINYLKAAHRNKALLLNFGASPRKRWSEAQSANG
ncbi:MAG: GxxExxY protein [Sulfuritalea sp.]|nr:GxxExxY protein [Sulfuritalea sp.]